MNDGVKNRLLKLLELSRRGVGGEAENALDLLNRALEKHNMTLGDLEDDAQELIEMVVSYKTKWERKLFHQITYKVVQGDFDAYRYPRARKTSAMVTRAQKAEIAVQYEIYRKALKDEYETFFKAFIQKHRLFDDSPGKECRAPEEDDYRAALMAANMKDVQITKRIEAQDE